MKFMDKIVLLPLQEETVEDLRAGDRVLLRGVLYTARDAAHKQMQEDANAGKELPISLEGATIYYAGPCPAKPGEIIGSIGPTTSGRMDSYAPALLDHGLKGMMGKGDRSPEVVEAMVRNKSIYFAAVGGAGALLKEAVRTVQVVAYEDLGTEAIRRLEVWDFPAIVAIDSKGNNIYQTEIQKYKKTTEEPTWA